MFLNALYTNYVAIKLLNLCKIFNGKEIEFIMHLAVFIQKTFGKKRLF